MNGHVLTAVLLTVFFLSCGADILIDDSTGLAHRFDGIGGLSAGASSRLLFDYDEPYRSDILDYLFTPNFGANMHILKVEIGGDGQSTDGTEASHMHTPNDQNYERGYEWWLMQEAKKRNPDILIYALSWAFPGWISNTSSPYTDVAVTANYVANWYAAAQREYGIRADYAGVWNERAYDTDYIAALRQALDHAGAQQIQIVASDGGWICADMVKDARLAQLVDVVGAHYPATKSPEECQLLHEKPLWSSEDFSTVADTVGGGCWARTLNQNYVNGNITATISWALIASWDENLPYPDNGLMVAVEPWSGHYQVNTPIWASAHTTQFVKPGWRYLKHGSGVGWLPSGGSYVSLSNGNELTIIIEALTKQQSVCLRDTIDYDVTEQTVTFQLSGSFSSIQTLSLWWSHFSPSSSDSEYFQQAADVRVENSRFTLTIHPDYVYTLSTTRGQRKGSHGAAPNSSAIPTSYSDDFEQYPLYSEAKYFQDQSGSFEIARSDTRGQVMRQMTLQYPVEWCSDATPISFIGTLNAWANISVDVLVEQYGQAMLAARVSQGGCDIQQALGVFFWLDAETSTWTVTGDILQKNVLAHGPADFHAARWYRLTLLTHSTNTTGLLDNAVLFTVPTVSATGWAAIGSSHHAVQFDRFHGDQLPMDLVQCAVAYENYPQETVYAELMCPQGTSISQVVFASYGRPSGYCGDFKVSSCNAQQSVTIVQQQCLHKNSCKVWASYELFGDPCPNQGKWLAIQIQCL